MEKDFKDEMNRKMALIKRYRDKEPNHKIRLQLTIVRMAMRSVIKSIEYLEEQYEKLEKL